MSYNAADGRNLPVKASHEVFLAELAEIPVQRFLSVPVSSHADMWHAGMSVRQQ